LGYDGATPDSKSQRSELLAMVNCSSIVSSILFDLKSVRTRRSCSVRGYKQSEVWGCLLFLEECD
jgi:hypothetical protein